MKLLPQVDPQIVDGLSVVAIAFVGCSFIVMTLLGICLLLGK